MHVTTRAGRAVALLALRQAQHEGLALNPVPGFGPGKGEAMRAGAW